MFRDRTDAGERLADALATRDLPDPVVLALPRGGVPVALPVAKRLGAPLDLLLVRKIGMPGNRELAAGAVVEGGAPVFNPEVLRFSAMTARDFDADVAEKRAEIAARRAAWLAGRDPVDLTGKTAIVVDDGIATGATVKAALQGLATRGAQRVVLAIPVAPADSLAEVAPLCDEVICLETPAPFYAVGAHYRVFDQVADDAVAEMLTR
ncbi:MAG TPA: phosphoribosyl transferase [Rhodobacteraceae bacterium]|nr:phosphoribosyl transferase [Paracoccaceae bacterium]